MTKILYLTTGCFDKGGISRYNRYQIRALREIYNPKNIKVLSLSPPREGDFEDYFEVDFYAWGTSLFSKFFFVLRVIKEVYFWNPKYIWLGHINFCEILVRFKLFNKVKSILNVYGLEVWSGLRPQVENGFRKIDFIISDCHFTANYCINEGYRLSGSMEVIWDCVDLERFNNNVCDDQYNFYTRYNLPNPKVNPWILTLGRLSKSASHKGYERLIDAFSEISKKEEKCVLVFAGKGDMKEFLTQKAKDFDISERVFFSGMVHEDDLPKFYRASRVFSLVSDRGVGRGEGIPLTPLEAMACGSPIIVGNQDGSQEAIFENKNGFCIPPFDKNAHIKSILSLIQDDELYNSMFESGIKISKKYFSYENFKAKHKAFLDRINHG